MVRVQQGKTGETIQNRYFQYDSLGRLIRVRQPEQEVNTNLPATPALEGNSQWTAGFVYDIFGNVKRSTDASGVNIVYEYDKANRVTKRCYTKPNITTTATECSQITSTQLSVNTPTVEYFYDGIDFATQQTPYNFAKGKLTKVFNTVSQTRYTSFDHLGRLKAMEQRTPLDGQAVGDATAYISTYEYNLSGALVKETYPSGRVVENEFEADGDLMRIYGKANAGAQQRTYANSFSYTADGKIASLKLGNGLWESAKFNTRLQLTELALGHSVGEGSLWKLNYAYGELAANGTDVEAAKNTGNIAKQTVSFNGLAQELVQTYKYDSLYRLKEAKEMSGATQTWIQQLDYDRFGNRKRAGSYEKIGAFVTTQDNRTFPTINAADNRFTTGQGYVYDKTGNIKGDVDTGTLQTRDFIFDGENKQTEVKQNANTISKYYYDGQGKRVKKELYSGGVVTETTVFVYSNGKLIAEYSTVSLPADRTTSYTATDQLGSPRVITNSFGTVISRRDFMPFGEEIPTDGTIRTSGQKYGAADSVRQRFTGYQKDIETGLDFAEARMYNNAHGRFTAIDPLLASGKSANPQTFNRYSYVMNNPLAFTDPTGLQAGSPKGAINPTGSWFNPGDGGRPIYVKNGDPIRSGYEPITESNRWSDGTPVYQAQGLDKFHVVRLHPNGPREPLPTVDVRNGQAGYEPLSDFERSGWEVIWSDKMVEPVHGVRTAIAPHDIALMGMGGIGGRAVSSAGAETAAAIGATEGIGGKVTFEVIDGVRRAKSFQMLGKETIDANIFDGSGNLLKTQPVSVNSLLSPNKSAIELFTEKDKNRFFNLFNDLKSGSPLKRPIDVNVGSRGIPIKDIEFDYYNY